MCFLIEGVLRNSGGYRITEQGYLRILSNSRFPPNPSLSGKLPCSSALLSSVPLLLFSPFSLLPTRSPSPGHSFSPSPLLIFSFSPSSTLFIHSLSVPPPSVYFSTHTHTVPMGQEVGNWKYLSYNWFLMPHFNLHMPKDCGTAFFHKWYKLPHKPHAADWIISPPQKKIHMGKP